MKPSEQELIDQFMAWVEEPVASPERARQAEAFNRSFKSYLGDDPAEAMRTFARMLSTEGHVSYTRAFTDVVQLRATATS
ncbi:MAG: hypothetical protein ABI867_38755 [Kofleriaceae bacterium]